jgi:hypothetical protein
VSASAQRDGLLAVSAAANAPAPDQTLSQATRQIAAMSRDGGRRLMSDSTTTTIVVQADADLDNVSVNVAIQNLTIAGVAAIGSDGGTGLASGGGAGRYREAWRST